MTLEQPYLDLLSTILEHVLPRDRGVEECGAAVAGDGSGDGGEAEAAAVTALDMADSRHGHGEEVAGHGGAEAGSAVDAKAERDWAAIGKGWAERVTQEGWWREPELGLAELARRLGTNTRYLSRALNEGLGVSFSELINRQRVEEAKRRLGGEGEILAIALEVGFASKASFNRALRAYASCTPSEFRTGTRRGS